MKRTRLVLASIVTILVIAAAAYLALTPFVGQPPSPVLTKVRFVLNFGAIDGHHVPYFVALDKGWYTSEGLDVEIVPGRTSAYAVEQVGAGNADLGVATADVILSGRTRGAPVRAVYILFQSNPAGIAAPADKRIRSPADLVGKKVGAIIGATQDIQFDILIRKLAIDGTKIEKVPMGFDAVAPLVARSVDAVQIWATDIPKFRAVGLNVTAFYYREYGLNFYSLAIFSTDEFIKSKPDVVRKFLKVTDQSIRWVMDHPGEAVDIAMKYTAYNLPESRLLLFDRLEVSIQLMKPSPETILGQMSSAGWSQLQDLLFEFAKIKQKVDVDSLFTTEFIPKA